MENLSKSQQDVYNKLLKVYQNYISAFDNSINNSKTSIRDSIEWCIVNNNYIRPNRFNLPPCHINVYGKGGSGKGWLSLNCLKEMLHIQQTMDVKYIKTLYTIYKDAYLKGIYTIQPTPSILSAPNQPTPSTSNGQTQPTPSSATTPDSRVFFNMDSQQIYIVESLPITRNDEFYSYPPPKITITESMEEGEKNHLDIFDNHFKNSLSVEYDFRNFKIIIVIDKKTEEVWKKDLNRLNLSFFQISQFNDLLVKSDQILLITTETLKTCSKNKFMFQFFSICIIDEIDPKYSTLANTFLMENIIRRSIFKIFLGPTDIYLKGNFFNTQFESLKLEKHIITTYTLTNLKLPKVDINSEFISLELADKVAQSTINTYLPKFLSLNNLSSILNSEDKQKRLFSMLKEVCCVCYENAISRANLSCCNSLICSQCYFKIINTNLLNHCPFCKSIIPTTLSSLKLKFLSVSINFSQLDGRIVFVFNRPDTEIKKILDFIIPKSSKFIDEGVTRKLRNEKNNSPYSIVELNNLKTYTKHAHFYFNFNTPNHFIHGSNFDDVKYIVFFDSKVNDSFLEKFVSFNRKIKLQVYEFS